MDYLFGTPYEIEQPKDMYHFSSDSELLGRFLKIGRINVVFIVLFHDIFSINPLQISYLASKFLTRHSSERQTSA